MASGLSGLGRFCRFKVWGSAAWHLESECEVECTMLGRANTKESHY